MLQAPQSPWGIVVEVHGRSPGPVLYANQHYCVFYVWPDNWCKKTDHNQKERRRSILKNITHPYWCWIIQPSVCRSAEIRYHIFINFHTCLFETGCCSAFFSALLCLYSVTTLFGRSLFVSQVIPASVLNTYTFFKCSLLCLFLPSVYRSIVTDKILTISLWFGAYASLIFSP